MLGCIGCKLMQGKADVLHVIGAQKERWTLDLHPWAGSEQVQLRLDQVAQPSSLPVLAHHEVLRFRQSLNALTELLDELINACGLARRLQGHPLHDGELVLGTVGELLHQERGVFLATLKLRRSGAQAGYECVRLKQR